MSQGKMLSELTRQVRRDTIRILEAAEARWLTFAPEGTSNHILWHVGHVMYVQDAICRFLLHGTTALPTDWADTYGMNCRPVKDTTAWPEKSEMMRRLEQQRDELVELLDGASDEQLARVADPDRGTASVADRIIHACHDEAKHSGEMYLLLKICRAAADTKVQH